MDAIAKLQELYDLKRNIKVSALEWQQSLPMQARPLRSEK
jgi:hypothetical protein